MHQVEEERYRTLPPDLSGRFIAHCWFDIAGSDKRRIDTDKPDNGIGRLIMSFAFGFAFRLSPVAVVLFAAHETENSWMARGSMRESVVHYMYQPDVWQLACTEYLVDYY